jgi:DNA-binding response OmpR family regulator
VRILLVEDDCRLATYIEKQLHSEGFAVDKVHTGQDAEAALGTVRYDAGILDIGLPDTDGRALLKAMRRRRDTTPVIILTAQDGLDDRLTGLNAGADDYLPKPFAMAELVARIRALLRRPGAALGVTLSAGNITYDTIARETSVGDRPVHLSRRETAALDILLRRLGRVIPKDVLEDTLYGFNEIVSSNSVEVLIHRLRKRLEAAKATVQIHTVRGVGYLLTE